MATPRHRIWRDARDGTEWEILFNPGVEEDPPELRFARSGLVFRRGDEELHAPAVFGDDLDTLTETDLQGLLDQARRERARGSELREGADGAAADD